jgi:hypothetical protein
MTPEQKRAWNRAYYYRNREKRLAQQKEYWRDFKSKGIRKPRKPHQPRSVRDHERYIENREAILAKQKVYRETHKAEIKSRRRQRILNNIRNYYERREQQHTAGDTDSGANTVGHFTAISA